MILKPKTSDLKVIGLYTGKIIIGVGLLMVVPMLLSLVRGEWNPAIEFFIGICACLIIGLYRGNHLPDHPRPDLGPRPGGGQFFLAARLRPSAPFRTGCRATSAPTLTPYFDVMSGFTTTGMYLDPGPGPYFPGH